MSRQGDRPHRRRRSPHDLQVGSSSAEPHESMEDFERRIDQITGELDRLGVNDRNPRENTERREKSQELEAAVQSYVHHLQDSQSPPREGDPARRGAVAAQGGQRSTDALGGDHTWSERELQDHVRKIHGELASLERVQDEIIAKVRPKKTTPAEDEPRRTHPVRSEPRNASRSPLTERPFVSRLDADDDNVEDEESLDRLDRNLFGRRRSLGFPALPGEPKDTIRQEIAMLIERLERSHPDAQGRLALQEALARKERALEMRLWSEEDLRDLWKFADDMAERAGLAAYNMPITPDLRRLWNEEYDLRHSPASSRESTFPPKQTRHILGSENRARCKVVQEAGNALMQESGFTSEREYNAAKQEWVGYIDQWMRMGHLREPLRLLAVDMLQRPIDSSAPRPPIATRLVGHLKRVVGVGSDDEHSTAAQHALGKGEGTYRMRRRYFGERY